MSDQKKHPGAPTYHSTSARKGRMATHSVSHRYEPPKIMTSNGYGACPIAARGIPEIRRDQEGRLFKTGFALGFAIAAAIFGLILWLWVIPTMDAAVATAQGMVL